MKAGERVVIYKDPATRKTVEGMASLVQRWPHMHCLDRGECWIVRFEGSDDSVARWVRNEDV